MIDMDRKKNLETCLVVTTGFVIIFLFKNWTPLLIVAAIVGFIGVFLNKPASWITWVWYKIADILGMIVPKLVLTLVFFLILFPVSVISRIFRKKGLGVYEVNKATMWISRDYTFSKDDLSKPW